MTRHANPYPYFTLQSMEFGCAFLKLHVAKSNTSENYLSHMANDLTLSRKINKANPKL